MSHRLIITLPDEIPMEEVSSQSKKRGYRSASDFICSCLREKMDAPIKNPATCLSEIESVIKKYRSRRS
jgi:metal-responsive CopG/Arc/MetJ family transcriptional regulator